MRQLRSIGLLEYVLVIALIMAAVIAAIVLLSPQIFHPGGGDVINNL